MRFKSYVEYREYLFNDKWHVHNANHLVNELINFL